jgi:hypothetical protein
MRSSTDKAMELLKSWAATKASLRFIFFSEPLIGIRFPKVPFFAEFDEAGERLTLKWEEWSFEFSLLSADVSNFRITEDESDSVLFEFEGAKLHLFTFKPTLDTRKYLQ